jgi:hypothetical protein
MPSVALHVVEFTFLGGFESHSLRQSSNRSQKCGFRDVVTIFERFLLLKIVKSLDSQYWTSREFHGKPHRNALHPHQQRRQGLVLQAGLP